MNEPIEKVAERVVKNQWRTSAERLCVTSTAALPLAKEVLSLRALCGVMGEALDEVYRSPATVCARHKSDVCDCGGVMVNAALASYRAHFPSPDVNPAEPKEK